MNFKEIIGYFIGGGDEEHIALFPSKTDQVLLADSDGNATQDTLYSKLKELDDSLSSITDKVATVEKDLVYGELKDLPTEWQSIVPEYMADFSSKYNIYCDSRYVIIQNKKTGAYEALPIGTILYINETKMSVYVSSGSSYTNVTYTLPAGYYKITTLNSYLISAFAFKDSSDTSTVYPSTCNYEYLGSSYLLDGEMAEAISSILNIDEIKKKTDMITVSESVELKDSDDDSFITYGSIYATGNLASYDVLAVSLSNLSISASTSSGANYLSGKIIYIDTPLKYSSFTTGSKYTVKAGTVPIGYYKIGEKSYTTMAAIGDAKSDGSIDYTNYYLGTSVKVGQDSTFNGKANGLFVEDVGNDYLPVYFKDGIPSACTTLDTKLKEIDANLEIISDRVISKELRETDDDSFVTYSSISLTTSSYGYGTISVSLTNPSIPNNSSNNYLYGKIIYIESPLSYTTFTSYGGNTIPYGTIPAGYYKLGSYYGAHAIAAIDETNCTIDYSKYYLGESYKLQCSLDTLLDNLQSQIDELKAKLENS